MCFYTPVISAFFHPVASASFGPQNYTLPEGISVELTIQLDKVCTMDVVFTVTTMDITAEGEWKVLVLEHTVQH